MLILILSLALAAIAPAAEVGDACRAGNCPIDRPAGAAADAIDVDRRPIVRISNTHPAGRALGSGTLVDATESYGLVLTCAHLFREGRGKLVVTFSDGAAYAAELVRIDAAADLAALSIAGPGVAPVELADSAPQRGDPLVSCGYGSDDRLWCNQGEVLGYVTTVGSHGRETIELRGTARLGDSGGPMLDRQGRLVGVLFGTDGRVVDGTFCGRIRQFLKGLSPRFGKQMQPSPAPVRPERPSPKPPQPIDPLDGAADALAKATGPWLAAEATALLVSFGVPGGIAGVAAGVAVWLVMRRGKRRLQAQLDRLRTRRGERVEMPSGETSGPVVERHHNRYVPYEVSLLDKAWAQAHARVGERYPGAVPYLKIVEGVKDQLLSGEETTI